jgi:hypothetical protein
MTPQDFVRKWAPGGPAHALNERAGAQAHFIDLCRVLDVPEPGDAERYCFERGVRQTGSLAQRTDGFADVWLRGHFAWEYKAPGKNLEGALRQLMMYALPLESPPLLVVSDRLHIRVHTHFTGTPSECHAFALDDLLRADARARLRRLWTEPEAFRPARSNRDITEEAARTFAATAERLRAAGTPAGQVSHFLTQCVFSFFAEDVGLLPARLFERLVGVPVAPAVLRQQLAKLFEAMRDGGLFGVDAVPWFNGGLFATIAVPPLADADVAALKAASALDWSAIDPSIFGTLFERGLDPAKRSQLGAHYTDPATIQRLVQPVVQRPLLDDWAQVRQRLQPLLARSKRHGDKAWRDAQAAFVGTLERLKAYRVLDPACGSGNFLYLALKCLKDVEHQINLEAEQLGLERQLDGTGPHNVLGIELNEYAAELARVTVWIGELQWRIQQGYGFKTQPVLEALDHIECRDAVLNADGTEAAWPVADAVVGNPPFVGDKKMRGELGDVYTEALRAAYKGRVPGGADLVCYWFERARAEIEAGRLQRAGLVSTNSIRGGRNRGVLDRVCATTRIFEAWSDEPWINDGAAVRVSLVGFGQGTAGRAVGRPALRRDCGRPHRCPRRRRRHGPDDRLGPGCQRRYLVLGHPEDRAVRDAGRGCTKLAVPSQSQWQAEQRRGSPLVQRHRRDTQAARHVDLRFRCGHVARRGGLVRATVCVRHHARKADPSWQARGSHQRVLLAFSVVAAGHAQGHCRIAALHRYARGCQTPCLCLATRGSDCGQEPGGVRPRRRHHFRHPAQPPARAVVVAPGHVAGRPAALHPHHLLRDLSLPCRPDARRHRAPAHRKPARRRADPRGPGTRRARARRSHRHRCPTSDHTA